MDRRVMRKSLAALSLTALAMTQTLWAAEQAPPAKQQDVKSCSVCHKPVDGQLRAFFDQVALKSGSIQLKLDNSFEVVKFDADELKVVNGSDPKNVKKSLKEIKKGHEVRVAYVVGADGIKQISEISIKPAMKVPAEKQLKVEEVEKLLSGKVKYTLVDARPPVKFQEGSIPTAINIPLPAFQKNLDKLPKDKGELLVYFCAGVT